MSGLILLCSFTLAGCASVAYRPVKEPGTDPTVASTLELQIGAAEYSQLVSDYRLDSDPVITKRLEKIGERIVPWVHRPNLGYRFFVLDTPELNASAGALADGRVYFSRQAIEALGDDEVIAAVLAHELAHISLKHNQAGFHRAVSKNRVDSASELTMDVLFSTLTLGCFSLTDEAKECLLNKSYTVKQEIEADQLAAFYLKKAGMDPRACLKAMDRLSEWEKQAQKKSFLSLSSHPSCEERRAHVERYIEEVLKE